MTGAQILGNERDCPIPGPDDLWCQEVRARRRGGCLRRRRKCQCVEGAISPASDYDPTNFASRVVEKEDQPQGEQAARVYMTGVKMAFVIISAFVCLVQMIFPCHSISHAYIPASLAIMQSFSSYTSNFI